MPVWAPIIGGGDGRRFVLGVLARALIYLLLRPSPSRRLQRAVGRPLVETFSTQTRLRHMQASRLGVSVVGIALGGALLASCGGNGSLEQHSASPSASQVSGVAGEVVLSGGPPPGNQAVGHDDADHLGSR